MTQDFPYSPKKSKAILRLGSHGKAGGQKFHWKVNRGLGLQPGLAVEEQGVTVPVEVAVSYVY
mgnify:FL=1